MLNPITYSEKIVSDFLRYQLTTYPFADERLYAQMRALLSLEETRATPLLRGPYISLSRSFATGSRITDLVHEGVLHPHLAALAPHPTVYGHQEAAFRAIGANKTTLVSTGTGSGKTECFLYPIVSHCLRLRDEGAPDGIAAVLVYPMNALAEDQLGRLRQLLCGTGVSFGMYVGKTKERAADVSGLRLPASASRADYDATVRRLRAEKHHQAVLPPEERASREEMRTPGRRPRILLTNVKQLELLLTRQQDIELFEGARLDFLVFDEAHTFSGAVGAETACLVRRLRSFCGKQPGETVCIATSATIADPERGREAGRDFASRFFGVEPNDVELIGEQYEEDLWADVRTPTAPFPGDPTVQLQTVLEAVAGVEKEPPSKDAIAVLKTAFQAITGSSLDPRRWAESLYDRLAANEVVYQIADALKAPRPLADLVADLERRLGRRAPEEEIIAWLALGAASRRAGRPLVRPVVHAFVRGVGGAVATFPERHEGPRVWLSREDAAAAGDALARLDITTCTTCGQHYFVHFVADFSFSGKVPGGGEAVGSTVVWKPMEHKAGGARVVLLDRRAAGDDDADDDEEPRNSAQVHLCRWCGALHPKAGERCGGCGRPGPLVELFAVAHKEDNPGHLTSCVACQATGGVRLGQYREPARPVRAQTVSDVHVLAQSMIQHAERRRLLVFTDNRQDAAFQAGWMQDHGRRFRLRSLMHEHLNKGPTSVGDLAGALDDLLERDEDMSRAIVPEVWRDEPKESTGTRHARLRRRYLRMQVLRELVTGMKQRLGLEPWGRLLVDYQGLRADLPFFAKWAARVDADAASLRDGVATFLDHARRSGVLLDNSPDRIFSRYWHESDAEIARGYIPLMLGGPKGLKLRRAADDAPARVRQWLGARGSTATRQAALRWGVKPEEVEPFFEELWALLTDGLSLLVPVTLTGRREAALPGCRGVLQLDSDRLVLHGHRGLFRCTTCRRANLRPTPRMACPAWRCKGTLEPDPETTDNYDLMVLDEGFAMVRPREHSAQVPQDEREQIERAFKGDSERTNTLVCTPTLELGVDIGALDAVLMRNVPPLPANYWQRAGRAGRRHRMAVNVTYASSASHDRAYFAAPLKMLHGVIEPPRFNLKNRPMVQKHVHATVLTALHRLARSPALSEVEREEILAALAHCFPSQIKAYLFDAAEHVRAVPFDVGVLSTIVSKHGAHLLAEVERVFAQGWPVGDKSVVEPPLLRSILVEMGSELAEVIRRLERRLRWALEQMQRLDDVRVKKGTLDPDEDALRGRCDRLVKRLKGQQTRARRDAEGYDDTYTYAVLAAEGFLPGYGLDTGTVVGFHQAARYGAGMRDWELRRALPLAIREYAPGNLIYANGHRFLPRFFHLEAVEPTLFQVDLTNGAVTEAGVGADTLGLGLGAMSLPAMPICDVDLPHQSHITDEEDHRFQLPVTVLGHEQKRHGGGRAFTWGERSLTRRAAVHMRLLNVGATQNIKNGGALGYPVCLVCGQSRSALASKKDRDAFSKDHLDRCGRQVGGVGFFADVVADAIGLHGCGDLTEAYSVAESLRRGAAEVLEVEVGDLQLLAIGRAGESQRDVLLYDPMPGGSGLLEQVIARWEEIVAAALSIVEGCPSSCTSACIDCLLHYRNSFYHAHLDRHVAAALLRSRGGKLVAGHDIPPQLPAMPAEVQSTNRPEAVLRYMLERAGFSGAEAQHPIDLGKPLGVTTPDFFFEDPSGRYDGICVYLDGMGDALHGNPATQRRDRAIREELRARSYEVFEIPYGQLSDPGAMRQHFYRLGRSLVGKDKATAIRDDVSWFEAAVEDHRSEHPPPPEGVGWDEVFELLDEEWVTLARGLRDAGVPVPDFVDWDITRGGRVSGERAVLAWVQGAPFVALVDRAFEPTPAGCFVEVSPASVATEVAAAVTLALGGDR